jgi:uncharacterized membrane protein YhiD involved in acid resistance
MKSSNSILRPITWSILLLAAFFSLMYLNDQIHNKQIENEKYLLIKIQAEAENEKKMYGNVSDSTQHKLDSLGKDISTVEHAR